MPVIGSSYFVSRGPYELQNKNGLSAALGNFPIYVSGFCLHFTCLFSFQDIIIIKKKKAEEVIIPSYCSFGLSIMC